jgi:iron complex transport system substrate-binding protein
VTALAVALVLCASPEWLGPKPPAEVKRVVTMAPSLTETVVAVGAAERLVGVSRYDELPQVKALPRVGGFVDPNVEAVVALKPDLLVVQKAPGNQKAVETLAGLGVPVLALPLTSVQDALDATLTLGDVLGRPAQAKALVQDFLRLREKVRAEARAKKTKVKVLLAYGFSPLIVAGPGSFAHELLEDCGAENLAEKAPTAYPAYSLERAVALKPDLVIDAADTKEGKDVVVALPQLKTARWAELPTKDLLHPGPALGRALVGLCALVWPGGDGGTSSR